MELPDLLIEVDNQLGFTRRFPPSCSARGVFARGYSGKLRRPPDSRPLDRQSQPSPGQLVLRRENV
jgi:hypothetical protein